MESTTIIHTGRHCVFNMHTHLVFVTKYRRKVFEDYMYEKLGNIFRDVCDHFNSILVEIDGEMDHVHLLVNYPPKVSVSKLVNSLKGVSSRRMRQFFPELEANYYKGVLWSPSYFASSCGGAPISIIRQYIETQRNI